MAQVGFEPTIPVFVRAKTFHGSDHVATVISNCNGYTIESEFIELSSGSSSTPDLIAIYLHDSPS